MTTRQEKIEQISAKIIKLAERFPCNRQVEELCIKSLSYLYAGDARKAKFFFSAALMAVLEE